MTGLSLGAVYTLLCALYLPEIFCSLLAGAPIDGIPGVSGFRQYFGFLIVMLLLGVVFVCVWIKYLKKTKKEETVK